MTKPTLRRAFLYLESLFFALFVGGGLVNILLTQSIKQFYYNRKESASPNIIALVSALVVGGGGTAFAYMLLGVAWTVNNILCMFAMMLFVWMGSMIGYSKILETYRQFRTWQQQVNSGRDVVEATQELIDKTGDV